MNEVSSNVVSLSEIGQSLAEGRHMEQLHGQGVEGDGNDNFHGERQIDVLNERRSPRGGHDAAGGDEGEGRYILQERPQRELRLLSDQPPPYEGPENIHGHEGCHHRSDAPWAAGEHSGQLYQSEDDGAPQAHVAAPFAHQELVHQLV